MITSRHLKKEAIKLWGDGKTHNEIQDILQISIPKSTLSYWCRDIILPSHLIIIKGLKQKKHLQRIRELSRKEKKRRKELYLDYLRDSNASLVEILTDKKVSKIALSVLYMAEGSKVTSKKRASIVFANSNPQIITLFLKLFRSCYVIDETKMRCTVQCRADQNTEELMNFWSAATMLPLNQFYKSRIDARTIGKPTQKLDYKGVCRIEYFSAQVFWDIMVSGEILTGGR